MAPLDPNNTRRLYIDYEVDNVPHEMQIRLNGTASVVDTLDNLYYILDFCKGFLPTSWLITGVRLSAAGSNISVPFDYSASDLFGFVGTNGAAWVDVNHPRQLTWVGRSETTGRRVRLSIYGAVFNTPGNFRFGPGEVVFSSAEVIAALNLAATAGQFVTIDGSRPRWYPYVNVNFNSYWETERRSSS